MFRGLPHADINALSGTSEDLQAALGGMQLTPDVEQLLNQAASFDIAMLSLEEAQREAGLVGGFARLRVSRIPQPGMSGNLRACTATSAGMLPPNWSPSVLMSSTRSEA